MKTTLKKVLSMALALVLLVGVLPMNVWAEEIIITDRFGEHWKVDTVAGTHTCIIGWHTRCDNGPHSYTDDSDTTCNVCGWERTVSIPCTDNRCELENGHDGKHSYLCTVGTCTYVNGHPGKHSFQCTEGTCTYDKDHTGKHSFQCTEGTCTYDKNHTGKHSFQCTEGTCTYDKDHTGKHSFQCTEGTCTYDKDHTGKHSFQCTEGTCTYDKDHTGKHSFQCQTEGCEYDVHAATVEHSFECAHCTGTLTNHADGCPTQGAARPTTLTFNFFVNGTPDGTGTHSNEAKTVNELINLYCTVSGLEFESAKINGAAISQHTTVQLGQTVDIYLKTKATTSYIVYFNANVDASKDNRPIDSFVSGATMGDALDKLSTMPITRPGLYPTWFKLAGWYMDRACTTPVNRYAPITEDTVVYAKWERKYNYEVTLKLYTNGNTNTVVKVVDAFAYIQDDGILSNSEVTAIAKQYIQSNNDAPITAYGPFKSGTEWDNYCKYQNRLSTQNQFIAEDDPATVLHVMVHNAKIGNSTSSTGKKADSSNPKTGDMIMVPAAVMGTTVSALAVMFYLKKKRTV